MPKAFLSPGHGGSDTGAAHDGILEKDLNLEVALIAKKYLESAGIEVAMSRHQDIDVSLESRVGLANMWKADLFVGIHHNSYNGKAEGYEIYHYTNSANGNRIAKLIGKYFDELNNKRYIGGGMWAGSKPYDNYFVNKYTKMTACLTEFCFIDSPRDFEKYNPYSEAEAIAKGICDYFNVEFVGATRQVSGKERMSNYLESQGEDITHDGLIKRLFQIYANSLKTDRSELTTVHKILSKE